MVKTGEPVNWALQSLQRNTLLPPLRDTIQQKMITGPVGCVIDGSMSAGRSLLKGSFCSEVELAVNGALVIANMTVGQTEK